MQDVPIYAELEATAGVIVVVDVKVCVIVDVVKRVDVLVLVLSWLVVAVAAYTTIVLVLTENVLVCVAVLSVLVVKTRVVLRLYTVSLSAKLAVIVSTIIRLAPLPMVVVISTTDVKLVIEVTVVVDHISYMSRHWLVEAARFWLQTRSVTFIASTAVVSACHGAT